MSNGIHIADIMNTYDIKAHMSKLIQRLFFLSLEARNEVLEEFDGVGRLSIPAPLSLQGR